jgi:hypothetical protein
MVAADAAVLGRRASTRRRDVARRVGRAGQVMGREAQAGQAGGEEEARSSAVMTVRTTAEGTSAALA